MLSISFLYFTNKNDNREDTHLSGGKSKKLKMVKKFASKTLKMCKLIKNAFGDTQDIKFIACRK